MDTKTLQLDLTDPALVGALIIRREGTSHAIQVHTGRDVTVEPASRRLLIQLGLTLATTPLDRPVTLEVACGS